MASIPPVFDQVVMFCNSHPPAKCMYYSYDDFYKFALRSFYGINDPSRISRSTVRTYFCRLARAGFIRRVEDGLFDSVRRIPDNLTTKHLQYWDFGLVSGRVAPSGMADAPFVVPCKSLPSMECPPPLPSPSFTITWTTYVDPYDGAPVVVGSEFVWRVTDSANIKVKNRFWSWLRRVFQRR